MDIARRGRLGKCLVKTSLFALLAAASLLASCSTTSSTPRFSPWLGPSEVFTGPGGDMSRVDGMDVWDRGAPSRKLRLLGYITESAKSGTPVEQIVAMARAQGADAIVRLKPTQGIASWAVYKYAK